MGEIWIPNQAEHAAGVQKKMGSFPFSECNGGEPHYWEAKQLNKELKAHDEKLECCPWYGKDSFRWIINWTNREGQVLLVRTIEDDDENYEQPHIGYLRDLQKHDLWGAKSRHEQIKAHTEAERRQDAYERKMKEEEMAGATEKLKKMYRDAGWSQRGDDEDIENFSFGYGTTRGKVPS